MASDTAPEQAANKNNNNEPSSDFAGQRRKLSSLLSMMGYCACHEAFVLLEDHYNNSTRYESMEHFIRELNRTITFETDASSSVISPELAYTVINLLDPKKQQADTENPIAFEAPNHLVIKVKNVQYDPVDAKTLSSSAKNSAMQQADEFKIHYNFLYSRLNKLPVFQGDFQLTKLADLTASSQPSIRCICFGLLIKDISKIDGYMLIDSTGRVPVRINPDTVFRNRLAYCNCIVLIEGVYVNPDDVLFAANIGLPPILLDPIEDKSLACVDEKLVIILKELYLDDDDVCDALDMLFTGYNSMEDPPALFILIGDFTREPCEADVFKVHMKKLIRILRSCDNLKDCHFVFIPGQRDNTPIEDMPQPNQNDITSFQTKKPNKMPKCPLTKERIPVNLLQMSNFNNVHLATNPTHIYLGERLISVVAHSYLKELRKNLLHDLSDHREELFETARQIILSNAHLEAGIAKTYHSSMKLWHRPDLLVLADTEAFGNRYDFNLSKSSDTSMATLFSFSRQSNQFKVYYVRSGEVEDSQVTTDAYRQVEEAEESREVVQLVEDTPSLSEI